MQATGSFSKRIVVISGGGSAAIALPQAPNPPMPAAPASAALVRNRRRLCTMANETSPFLRTAGSRNSSAARPSSEDDHTPVTAYATTSSFGRADGRLGPKPNPWQIYSGGEARHRHHKQIPWMTKVVGVGARPTSPCLPPPRPPPPYSCCLLLRQTTGASSS